MFIAKSLTTVFIAVLAVAATHAVAKDAVYRWEDDQGVVHYSDLPAKSADATKVDINAGDPVNNPPTADSAGDAIYHSSSGSSRAQQQRDERTKSRREAAELKDQIAASCVQRRKLVARLEPRPRVMVRGADGEVYRMDDNDRLEALREAKAFIDENCDT